MELGLEFEVAAALEVGAGEEIDEVDARLPGEEVASRSQRSRLSGMVQLEGMQDDEHS